MTTTLLSLENDTKKKRGFYFVCLIIARFAKKGNGDKSENKLGWRCTPTI